MIFAAFSGSINSFDSIFQVFTVLIIFIIVLFVTYLVTKWVAKYQKVQMSSGNIKVIETCRLSQSKYIQIVQIGTVYMVIAVCKDTVTSLGILEEAQLDLEKYEQTAAVESFQEIFQRLANKKQKK